MALELKPQHCWQSQSSLLHLKTKKQTKKLIYNNYLFRSTKTHKSSVCAYQCSLVLTVSYRRKSQLDSRYKTDLHGNQLPVRVRSPLTSLESFSVPQLCESIKVPDIHASTTRVCVFHSRLVLFQLLHTSGDRDGQTFHLSMRGNAETESQVWSR